MTVELKPDNVASISILPWIVGTEHMTNFANQLPQSNTQATFANGYNWETPLLTDRVIAALATEANIMSHTGKVRIVAELAEKISSCRQGW